MGERLSARDLHSFDDVVVARAATDVPFETGSYFGFSRVSVLVQQIDGSHHHAGRTESALKSMRLAEGGLDWMQIAASGEARSSL